MKKTDAIQEFFLKAVQKGWAAGVEGVKIAATPDTLEYNKNLFAEGNFLFEERHSIVDDAGTPRFFLFITISQFEKVVWEMKYGGIHDERTVRFMKLALMQSYAEGHFIGGRGPGRFEHGEHPEWMYENRLFKRGINRFCGHDIVLLSHPETAVVQVASHGYYSGGRVAG